MNEDSKTRYVAQRNDTVKMYLNSKYLISRPLASLEFNDTAIPIEAVPIGTRSWLWGAGGLAEGLMTFSLPTHYIQYIPDPPVVRHSNNFWLDLGIKGLTVEMLCYNTGKYGDVIMKYEDEPVKVEVYFQTNPEPFQEFIDAYWEIKNEAVS